MEKKDITGVPAYKIARTGLALVSQGRRIFPSLSVEANLILGSHKKNADLDEVYLYFPQLKLRAKHGGNELSAGEQQMLAIGRALLSNPKLILMDEPSEGLAALLVSTIADITIKLKKDGMSIFLVEQNINLALKVSDFTYVLDKGKIVYECKPSELADNKQLQACFFGFEKFTEDQPAA